MTTTKMRKERIWFTEEELKELRDLVTEEIRTRVGDQSLDVPLTHILYKVIRAYRRATRL